MCQEVGWPLFSPQNTANAQTTPPMYVAGNFRLQQQFERQYARRYECHPIEYSAARDSVGGPFGLDQE